MQSIASSCSSLSSLADQMGSQGLNNYGAANSGQNCDQNSSGMSPQSAGGPNSDPNSQANTNGTNPNDPYGCQQNPSSAVCQNCTINPTSPTCKALAEGQKAETGKASFTTADKKTGGNPNEFNVPDTNTNATGSILPASTDPNKQAPEAHVIPNGSGGGIPGDQNSQPVQGGTPHKGGGPSGGSGFNVADIEQGMRSGGFSSSPGDQPNAANGYRGYGNGKGPGGGRMPASAGMDLKKYLPGQQLDPMNRMGGNSMVSAEINGKSCDMFKKISARIQEKCKLGVLLGCH
ncbi:MAG: hypothetical protein ACXVA9_09155 [Bdellovibrionales bacterium]